MVSLRAIAITITLMLSARSSFSAEKLTCSVSRFNGQSGTIGQPASVVLIANRIQDEPFPPVPGIGTYRIWEGSRILAEGPFLPNYKSRYMLIAIGIPAPGWHSIRAEYFDTSGRYSRCDSDRSVFYIGTGTPPASFLDLPGGEIYYDELYSLLLVAPAELAGTHENGRVHTVNAITRELLITNRKENLVVAGLIPRPFPPETQTVVLPAQLEPPI